MGWVGTGTRPVVTGLSGLVRRLLGLPRLLAARRPAREVLTQIPVASRAHSPRARCTPTGTLALVHARLFVRLKTLALVAARVLVRFDTLAVVDAVLPYKVETLPFTVSKSAAHDCRVEFVVRRIPNL